MSVNFRGWGSLGAILEAAHHLMTSSIGDFYR